MGGVGLQFSESSLGFTSGAPRSGGVSRFAISSPRQHILRGIVAAWGGAMAAGRMAAFTKSGIPSTSKPKRSKPRPAKPNPSIPAYALASIARARTTRLRKRSPTHARPAPTPDAGLPIWRPHPRFDQARVRRHFSGIRKLVWPGSGRSAGPSGRSRSLRLPHRSRRGWSLSTAMASPSRLLWRLFNNRNLRRRVIVRR